MPVRPRRRSFDCPHCGNAVPAKALACPACGSDASSGWSDEADAWAGDLPGGYDEEDDDSLQNVQTKRKKDENSIPQSLTTTASAQVSSLTRPSSSMMEKLPECVLRYSLEFVGENEFIFVAGINRQFRRLYTELFQDKKTSYQACLVSVPRASMTVPLISLLPWYVVAHGTARITVIAARTGSLEVLQWLRQEFEGYRPENCDAIICHSAARGGHLNVLQWARSQGCPWDERTCCEAALCGNFDVLKWARSEGCPWDEGTCFSASWHGHLDVLKWARSEGCPWNKERCVLVAKLYKQWDIVEWCRTQIA